MAPYTLKWGILATGGIATTFTKDLLTDPSFREVSDVAHTVVAAASSSSKSRAESFLKDVGVAPGSAKAYGSYAELVADPDVQIIYVATPHSHHFQNAMLALEAGKNVLCEKALTVNASQAKKLVAKAEEKGLFFMEAVWTRYFPLSIKIREMITSGEIGTVYRVFADNSFAATNPDGSLAFPDENRMVNINLAGGALLDLGIYSLTWVFQTLYHLQSGDKEYPTVVASINKYDRTGADDNTTVVVSFPKHKTMGIATTGLRAASDIDEKGTAGPGIRIQGSEGEIQVAAPAYRPERYSMIRKSKPGQLEVVDCPIPKDGKGWGHGMFWEADECARCLRDGKLESATMPWKESVVIMETMEEALKQGGVEYPELITTDVFDPNSPLNTGK